MAQFLVGFPLIFLFGLVVVLRLLAMAEPVAGGALLIGGAGPFPNAGSSPTDGEVAGQNSGWKAEGEAEKGAPQDPMGALLHEDETAALFLAGTGVQAPAGGPTALRRVKRLALESSIAVIGAIGTSMTAGLLLAFAQFSRKQMGIHFTSKHKRQEPTQLDRVKRLTEILFEHTTITGMGADPIAMASVGTGSTEESCASSICTLSLGGGSGAGEGGCGCFEVAFTQPMSSLARAVSSDESLKQMDDLLLLLREVPHTYYNNNADGQQTAAGGGENPRVANESYNRLHRLLLFDLVLQMWLDTPPLRGLPIDRLLGVEHASELAHYNIPYQFTHFLLIYHRLMRGATKEERETMHKFRSCTAGREWGVAIYRELAMKGYFPPPSPQSECWVAAAAAAKPQPNEGDGTSSPGSGNNSTDQLLATPTSADSRDVPITEYPASLVEVDLQALTKQAIELVVALPDHGRNPRTQPPDALWKSEPLTYQELEQAFGEQLKATQQSNKDQGSNAIASIWATIDSVVGQLAIGGEQKAELALGSLLESVVLMRDGSTKQATATKAAASASLPQHPYGEFEAHYLAFMRGVRNEQVVRAMTAMWNEHREAQENNKSKPGSNGDGH